MPLTVTLHVVGALSGEALCSLRIERSSLVRAVKEELCRRLEGLPPAAQRLLLGDRCLQDGEKLGDLLPRGTGSAKLSLLKAAAEAAALRDIEAGRVELEDLSEALRGNRDVVLAAIGADGLALEHASEELRRDRDVVLTAVKESGAALRHASSEVQADKDIVMAAVKQYGMAAWWRPAKIASGMLAGAGTAVALTQAMQLGEMWRTQLRGRAGACKGATEGLERMGAGSGSTLLLFLGDSLVEGVGGQAEGAPSPAALPRNVAAQLAERLGSEVQWASVGITGADVERLQKEGLPRLREKVAAQPNAQNIVVVLVVGANDLRKMKFLGYRLSLRRLVEDLRRLGGGRGVDAVFLPGLRIPDAPMLQRFPLQCFLSPVCALWEREKLKAVKRFREVQVLPFPAPPPGQALERFFSADQIHPSISGYEWWGQDLARQIHCVLTERRSRTSGCDSGLDALRPRSLSCADMAVCWA